MTITIAPPQSALDLHPQFERTAKFVTSHGYAPAEGRYGFAVASPDEDGTPRVMASIHPVLSCPACHEVLPVGHVCRSCPACQVDHLTGHTCQPAEEAFHA